MGDIGIGKLGDIGGAGQTLFGSVLVDGTENLRSAINHYSDETGVYATLDESNHLVLTAPDGRNIAVTTTGDGTIIIGCSKICHTLLPNMSQFI